MTHYRNHHKCRCTAQPANEQCHDASRAEAITTSTRKHECSTDKTGEGLRKHLTETVTEWTEPTKLEKLEHVNIARFLQHSIPQHRSVSLCLTLATTVKGKAYPAHTTHMCTDVPALHSEPSSISLPNLLPACREQGWDFLKLFWSNF